MKKKPLFTFQAHTHTFGKKCFIAPIAKILNVAFIALLVIFASCKKSAKTNYTPTPSPYPINGLVSYFNFDENLKDQQAYTNDGVNTSNATFTPGKGGKAITLNGTTQKITFSPKVPKTSANLSVSFWFKTSDIVSKYFINSGSFRILKESGMRISFTAVPIYIFTTGSFVSGEWTHVAGIFDGKDTKTYINGVLADTKSSPGNTSGFNSDLVLGYQLANVPLYWAGSIDDLFIYNRALTKEEVATLYKWHLL